MTVGGLVGCSVRFDDRVTGRVNAFASRAKIIHIDIDPTSISKNVVVDVPIVADCKQGLSGLIEETDKIMKAQSSRGADYDTGGLIARARGLVSVLIPLFVSAFKRAEDLAVAMEARCYRGGDSRTRLRIMKYQSRDVLFGISIMIASLGILALRVLLS